MTPGAIERCSRLVLDKQEVVLQKRELAWLSLWFALTKLVTGAVLIGSFYLFSEGHSINLWNRWFSGADDLESWYLPFANWDGQHYLLLSEWGYDHWQSSQAFYPLFPLLIRGVTRLVGDPYLAAVGINLLLSWLGAVFLYLFARAYLERSAALFVAVALFAYPASFFLVVIYSEALFLALAFGFLYFYGVRQSNVSLLFAFLLPLSRPSGLFLMAAVLLMIGFKAYCRRIDDLSYELSNVAAFVSGVLAFFVFYSVVAGSPTAAFDAQRLYYRGMTPDLLILNVLNPLHLLELLITVPADSAVFSLHKYRGMLDKAIVLLWIVGLIPVLRAKVPMLLFAYLCLGYFSAAINDGLSFLRFSLPVFPLLMIALLRARPPAFRWRWPQFLFLAGSFAVQTWLSWRFALNLWVA